MPEHTHDQHGSAVGPAREGSSSVPGEPGGERTLDRAGDIFLQVRDLGVMARDEAIDRACAGDVELKKLVFMLLRGDSSPLPVEGLADQVRAAYEAGASTGGNWSASRASVPGADRIGNYRILERLGEGGFGVVYLAEQERPVRRRVALKIIKLGMDTRQVVARFEAERQALAMMDHPNIAKVFDAGATETGRPYFVMELVRGLPMTEYCDRHKLAIPQRLELIAEVCDALQHAHQKGVIHRDIKPSNVLVRGSHGTRDRSGRRRGDSTLSAAGGPADPFRVKIIDFGIAKATSARLTEKTIFTEFRQMIGTPEYMSPEQAGESSDDVDTRTDVYSTGVLLYELLTGSTPFDSKRLRSAAFGEMQRIIREEDPPKPSTKLTTRQGMLDDVATQRATRADKLHGIVRGELDWIVMKALEKDRSRRYESAGEMAADIRRYLSGHAVHAAPPSRVYRVRSFVRRHRGAVTAATVVAAAMSLGLVGTTWGFVKAVRERTNTDRKAEELRLVAAFQERVLDQVDAARVGEILRADLGQRIENAIRTDSTIANDDERAELVGQFRRAWADVNTTDTARALIDRTLLQPAVSSIDRDFAEQPGIDALLRQSVASRYQSLGLFEQSSKQQTAAIKAFAAGLGPEHPETLVAMCNHAMLLAATGEVDKALQNARETLGTMRRTLGEDSQVTLRGIITLASVLERAGQLKEAQTHYRDALARSQRTLGDDNPDTLVTMNNLANTLISTGEFADAEPVLRDCVPRQRRVVGEDHPSTLTSVCNLGLVYKQLGRHDEAEPYLRDALTRRRRVLGTDHPDTLTACTNLGTMLLARRQFAQAEPLLAESLDAQRRTLGRDHPATLGAMNNFGALRRAEGKLVEAEPYYAEAAAGFRAALGDDHPTTVACVQSLASLLFELERYEDAEPLAREAMQRRAAALGESHQSTLVSVFTLGGALVGQGECGAALSLLATREPEARRVFAQSAPTRFASMLLTLGQARVGVLLKGGTESAPAREALLLAEANLREAHGVLGADAAANHRLVCAAARSLADLYGVWERVEPGTGRDRQQREWEAAAAGVAPGR